MSASKVSAVQMWYRDLLASVVVFLVALPLCLGIALASDAPLFSGLIAGIVGGIVVGLISGSHASVSGPAAGLTAVVAAQLASLGGSFSAFLVAVVLAGILQILLGLLRAGALAAFFPTSVIKGLLTAIGIILILKQIPHVFGHDSDPEGDFAFVQKDEQTTLSEIREILVDFQPGATVVGILSLLFLILWDRSKKLKKSIVPAPLLVVLFGVAIAKILEELGGIWVIEKSHMVQIPVAASLRDFVGFLQFPDFSQIFRAQIYLAAITIAAVASLETLLNLEAVDKLDPRRRQSPPSRELIAQGVGNVVSGLSGGLPITSVIVRSSVNIDAGAQTKLSAILHGFLLLGSVLFFADWMNQIPLACLAAILLVTGYKLANPKLFLKMWHDGPYQFWPFLLTVIAIVLTDLLIGVLIGIGISTSFILASNIRRPVRRIIEKHLGGEVVHIVLANQVSFLNRAAIERMLEEIPPGGHVLLDATATDFIDPDVLALIKDFRLETGPARNIQVSLIGFRARYQLQDQTQYVDYSTRELQSSLRPEQVLQILKDGHQRFLTGQRLTRDFHRQISVTASGQHPLAVVLSCIDSRTPTEIIFDLGLGDIFSVRIAGNVARRKVLGSLEYGCAVAGAKLILIMGHTRCGAVTTAVRLMGSPESAAQATGCEHLDDILHDIQLSIPQPDREKFERLPLAEQEAYVNDIARRNVLRMVRLVQEQSKTLAQLVKEGKIMIVGAMYDVTSGNITFLEEGHEPKPLLEVQAHVAPKLA